VVSAAAGKDFIQFGILFSGSDGYDSLVRSGAGHAIQLCARDESHRNAHPPAFGYYAVDAAIVTVASHSDVFETAAARSKSFRDSVYTVDYIHPLTV
jgi:hypothetical protein